MARSPFKTYYELAKPGIIYGNAFVAAGAFLFATRGHFHPGLFVAMLSGLSLIIASGCVLNNYIDRDIDGLMARTSKRALVTGAVSERASLIYATILGILGAAILGLFTNPITLAVALFGLFFYVVMYGIWKRRSVHGTLVGSISGAVPPVVGYCAVTGRLDANAAILFIILVIWQMPHFYAIAMYRMDDYASAGIPVLPIVSGLRAAKIQIIAYIVAFIIAIAALTAFGSASYVYLAIMMILGLAWLQMSAKGFTAASDAVWARKVFRFSLVTLMSFCAVIAVEGLVRR